MPVLRQLEQLPPSALGGAVAIGNFDGVHRGHQRIVARLISRAEAVGGPSLVFTFDPHPVRLLRPDQCPPPLTWTERKAELLEEQGVEWVLAYPTDRALLELPARTFYERIVLESLQAKALVEGPNFFFGHDRQGDVAQLARWSSASGVTLDVVEPLVDGGDIVSSSRIRRAIADGDVAVAGRLLGRPYRLRGMVTHGAGRGASLGFPTANLEAIDTLLPSPGVYAGYAFVAGDMCAAAIHLGPNPTFGLGRLKVEVHLIDRCVALYGLPLEVEFLARLREVQTFSSTEALVEQLQRDVAAARRIAEAADAEPSRSPAPGPPPP